MEQRYEADPTIAGSLVEDTGQQGGRLMHDRIYQGEDGAWYFRARGNQAVGPYESYLAAEQQLVKQIRTWSRRARPAESWKPRFLQLRGVQGSATRQT